MLTQDRLKGVLKYESDTGKFIYRIRGGTRRKIGDIAGYVNPLGYRVIRIDGVNHHAHRLIWLYQYGSFPDYLIDHINGNRDDNRLVNLRPATYKENSENQKLHRSNTSGYRGVSKDGDKWVACVRHKGKRVRKIFTDFNEAVIAVKEMRNELFTHHKTEYSA